MKGLRCFVAGLCVLILATPVFSQVVGAGAGSGSASIDYGSLTARDVAEMERSAYRERMAGIDDYWLVEHSNVAPLPTVKYYARNPPGVSPLFRLVPPLEMQQLQIEQDPNMTPEQRATAQAVAQDPAMMLEGYALAADRLREDGSQESPAIGAFAGELAKLSEGFRKTAASMRQQQAEDAKEAAGDQTDELTALADATTPIFAEDSKVYFGMYAPASFLQDRFTLLPSASDGGPPPAWKSDAAKQASGIEPIYDSDTSLGIACYVTKFDGPPFETEEGYVIERAEKWVAAGANLPIYVKIEVRRLTAAGFQRVTVERENAHYAVDLMLAHASVIRERIRGFSAALPEVDKRIEVGGVNEGVPSQMDVARVTGQNIGVPGADPTGGP